MSTSGFLILLISILSCRAAPNPENGMSCKTPVIDNGEVINPKKNGYEDNEVITFTCKEGFTANSRESTCTKDDWNPKPSCNAIVCSPYYPVGKGKLIVTQTEYKYGEEIDVECKDGYMLHQEPNKRRKCTSKGWFPPMYCVKIVCRSDYPVEKGRLIGTKAEYKYGEEINVECEDGYVLQEEPDKLRKCTSNGWDPPMRCVRKKCHKPDIKNGYIQYDDWYPKDIGSSIDYWCETNFLSPERKNRGNTECTNAGWNPEPKCLRQCASYKASFRNADIIDQQSIYLEGEKVAFHCNNYYETPDGKTYGKRTCLPDGEFTPAKCTKMCFYPDLQNGIFNPRKIQFEIGEYVQYECNEGYMTKSRNLKDIAQCLVEEWSEPLHCKTITCEYNGVRYRNGDVIEYTCPDGKMPLSTTGQCYYFGWGPPPICEEKKPDQPETTGPRQDEKQEQRQKCPPAYSPSYMAITEPKEEYYSNDTVTMKCDIGYKMYGSPTVRCIEGKWEQPPQCIRKIPCRNPQLIDNGDIIESFKQQTYVNDDIVQYQCKPGYYIIGSDEITCMNGQWSPNPTCTEYPCDEAPTVTHAVSSFYGKIAKYTCEGGFRLSREDPATCVKGEWYNIPTCIATSCKPPPSVPNARIIGRAKDSYLSGEKVTYSCNPGYVLGRSMTGEVVCNNTEWTELPVCRKIGEQCGPPPVVQFGNTTTFPQTSYNSGDSVEYKCPEHYVIEGNSNVRCLSGVWEEAPVCLEPCTAKEKDMDDNNIQLRWKNIENLNLVHGDNISFVCKSGYEAPPDTQMMIVCKKGKLKYPKCFKSGFCVLLSQKMTSNNIQYNVSTLVHHGETITFQCNEGMIPEDKLEAKCEWREITYPKCIASKSCKTPENLHGFLTGEQQAIYDSGSYVDFQCYEDYVKKSPLNVQCKNGEWMDLPVCLSPCRIPPEDLTKRNIQLLPSSDRENILDNNHIHGTEISVICKSGFRRPNQGALKIECYDGKLTYPRCFSGKTCRIDQDDLDENNLELDEVHNNEGYYAEGEMIQFQCKNGFRPLGKLTGTCSEQTLTYPRCTETSLRRKKVVMTIWAGGRRNWKVTPEKMSPQNLQYDYNNYKQDVTSQP